jgi:hypothetical protein
MTVNRCGDSMGVVRTRREQGQLPASGAVSLSARVVLWRC